MVQKEKMSIEENLKKNNIELPKAADPVGSYVATKEEKILLQNKDMKLL